MFTLEVVVPKQHVPEKFDRFIASSRIKVKETGEYVKLTRSAIPKILALKSVSINGLPLKDKSTKVKPNDIITIQLANIDSFKVDQQQQLKSEEQQEIIKQKQQQQQQAQKQQTKPADSKPWWEKNKEKEKDPFAQQQNNNNNYNNNPEIRQHSQIKKQPIKKPQNKSNNNNNNNNNNSNNSGNFNLVSTDIKLDIVYEDKDLAIINKPAGMLVHPTALTLGSNALVINKEDQTHTLVNALIHRYGGVENLSSVGGVERPGIVHRLDKDTAGMIIIARNNDVHQKLQTLFEKHTSTMITHTTIDQYEDNGSISNNQIERMLQGKKIPLTISKKYHCIVLGKPKEQHGFINKKISRHPADKNKMVIDQDNGKEALTEFKVLKVWENVNAKVLDNQKNKQTSKQQTTTNNNNNNNTTTNNIINSTLSEYDNAMNQLHKNKKKNTKKSNITSKNVNSRMQFLSVDDDDEEEKEDGDEDEKEDEDEEENEDEEDEEEEDDEEEDEEEEEEDDDDEDEEEEEDDEEEEDEEENYDEIILRLQQKTKMITSNTFSLLEVTLHTGRSHQIRVHMASENIPIVGDPIYSSKSKQFLVSYLLLASMNLKFVHPILNEIKEFSIQYPSHFKNFISSIEGTTETIKDNDDAAAAVGHENVDNSDEEIEHQQQLPINSKKLKSKSKSKSISSNFVLQPTIKNINNNINNNNNNNNNNNYINNNSNNTNNTKKKNSNYINSLNTSNNLEKDLLSDFLKKK
ncbi:hypothetical protein DDB_G0280463 [Dictyostelium discoideum AX4]|uniref:Pseudouridine synthase RsuA/RluA-like domain-containing protein n=1 Tax=Dictyostelium discoideum TaxID=44689 RepID=Q54VB9_DICDI|nr:hypothetical protein DDB_G0280463 [Dictyostelium discoideum AX4]EAL67210.1 hypothetical protein DDB_G0280463 [Dictyostelium discoideum AX4]|eukprot:XP_641190.1 hypothetical protein DDB_G0280463 [Dictyostelium discoideum AX4]